MNKRLLWLLVPVFALGEVAAHAYFAERAPDSDAWLRVKPAVKALAKRRELIVPAPAWTDPLARYAFGDELMPIAHLARPDLTLFERALEVSILGAHEPEVETWRVLKEEEHGDFTLRVRENPKPAKLTFSFVDEFGPERAQAFDGTPGSGRACRWNERGRVTAGGLGGMPTIPARRFDCAAPLGITVIDDEQYRPRRCIWASPTAAGLVIRYEQVPLGERIYGYTGYPWLIGRDGISTELELEVRVRGTSLGTVRHPKVGAWVHFELALASHARTTSDVEFEVRASPGDARAVCFYADSRF